MKLKNVVICGFLIELLVAPVRGYFGGWAVAGIVSFFLYLLFFILYRRKSNTSEISFKAVYLLMIPLFIMNVLPRLVLWGSGLESIPEIFGHLFGILAGYFLVKQVFSVKAKITFVLSLFLLTLFCSTYGLKYWFDYLTYRKENIVTIYKATPFDLIIENQTKATSIELFKGKTVLLDFWTTTCLPCFRKFPELEKVYNKYKNDSTVLIYAANLYFEGDSLRQCFNMIHDRGYTFPVLMTKDIVTITEHYKVNSVPTTILISPDGNIIFRGNLSDANDILSARK